MCNWEGHDSFHTVLSLLRASVCAALFIAVGVFAVIYKLKTRPHESLSDMDSGLDEKLVQPGVSFLENSSLEAEVDTEMVVKVVSTRRSECAWCE